ncbi:sigma-70 family RNA polymerase sigma factor [uncultured Chitinophaga sp.]|jgi:RNA polymerase sigma factor, sigma-70 family|uniref:RNA polymerase sigma factor n=1 Tax=uncultured Chitinophaga sp. TaxID=339340 RepID=UPI002609FC24|nr:sigma-70 family RNA polymerase sigma factor [uncultured Chitinophaga sp.]
MGNETWLELKNGSEAALLKLYNEHYVGLINYGVLVAQDRELAAECFTEVLIDIWDKRDRLPVVDNVRSYLMTCMRRAIIHKIRTEKFRQEKEQQLGQPEDTHEASYEERLLTVQMNEAMKRRLLHGFRQLTARQQELLQLRYFNDLSYEAIAEKCGISKRTTYNIIHSALKSLRENFETGSESSSLPPLSVLITCVLLAELLP